MPAPCPEGAGFVVSSAASSSSAPASGSIPPQLQRAALEVHQEFEQTFDPPPSADVIQAAERLGGARALAEAEVLFDEERRLWRQTFMDRQFEHRQFTEAARFLEMAMQRR